MPDAVDIDGVLHLPIQAAASKAGITRRTAYSWTKTGWWRRTKRGKYVYVPVDDVGKGRPIRKTSARGVYNRLSRETLTIEQYRDLVARAVIVRPVTLDSYRGELRNPGTQRDG